MSDDEETKKKQPLQSYITESGLPVGPQPSFEYPIKVLYCGNCSMPVEYCEYYSENEKCKSWLEKNLPQEFQKLFKKEGTADNKEESEEEKKRQKRGGKGVLKTKKKDGGPKKICVSSAPRGKNKHVTVVTGLKSYGIDLKVAAKFFGQKFACGSSVTGDDELVIQGDIKDDLIDLLPEKWPEIDEDSIEDLGELKR
nr:EOG090X0IUZ [Lepidurus arcticus]